MNLTREQGRTVEPSVPSVRNTEVSAQAPAFTRNVIASARGLQRFMATGIAPYLSRQIQYIGHTGVVGLGLMVFALAFFIGANSPLAGQLAQLQATLDEARAAHASPDARAVAAPEAQLEIFMSELPTRAQLPSVTEKIVAQAASAGIVLDRGTYDFTVTHSRRWVRARMTFPVHGAYPDIRRFVDATLVAVPGAALDGLRLERKDIGAAEVDADIRFVVYLRGGP